MLPVTTPLGCCCDGATCEPVSLAPIANVTICEGAPAALAAIAIGTAPILYQWYRGLAGDKTTPIPGATGATLNIAAATPADTGNYWVEAQNPCGNAQSNTVQLTVELAPIAGMTPPPPGPVPGPVLLQINTIGPGPFTYQWYNGPTAVGPFAPIGGATLDNYLAAPVAPSEFFQCIVSNPCGDTTVGPIEVLGAPPPA